MQSITPPSDGFILPLVLIIMFVMSLIIATLYHAESSHLAIFNMIMQESQTAKKQRDVQDTILRQVQVLNMRHPTQASVPDPIPEDQIYLRAFDRSTDLRVWQVKTNAGTLTMECNPNNHCKILE